MAKTSIEQLQDQQTGGLMQTAQVAADNYRSGPKYQGNASAVTTTSAESSMDDLYARNPGTVDVEAPGSPASTRDASASTVGSEAVQRAAGSKTGYDAATRTTTADELASDQLNRITAQDSPLMQRARASAATESNSRGLRNSSIAAGAAQAAMVDRATPLALQDAQTVAQQELSNQGYMNRAREFNAQAENTAGLTAAELEADLGKTNAQLQTSVSLANSEATNLANRQQHEYMQRASELNAAAQNQMRERVLSENAELNRQYLAGTQAKDLATIEGEYQQLLSQNEMASRMFESYYNGIANIMANDQLPPDRVAQYVAAQQSMLESGLQLLQELNGIEFDIALGGAIGGNPSTQQPSAPAGGGAVGGNPTSGLPTGSRTGGGGDAYVPGDVLNPPGTSTAPPPVTPYTSPPESDRERQQRLEDIGEGMADEFVDETTEDRPWASRMNRAKDAASALFPISQAIPDMAETGTTRTPNYGRIYDAMNAGQFTDVLAENPAAQRQLAGAIRMAGLAGTAEEADKVLAAYMLGNTPPHITDRIGELLNGLANNAMNAHGAAYA